MRIARSLLLAGACLLSCCGDEGAGGDVTAGGGRASSGGAGAETGAAAEAETGTEAETETEAEAGTDTDRDTAPDPAARLPATAHSAPAATPEPPLPPYVDESRCAGCHPEAARAWAGSHHDLAMQEATDATVLGDFDDAVFEHAGATTRFFRRDGRFVVSTPGQDGQVVELEVAYTFGVTPLQQYLLPMAGGRLAAFSIAWDAAAGRWFHLQGEQPPPPGDPFHWTGPYQNWNEMCAECHSTELHKNYDPASDGFDTTWELIDVACQACHGPAAAHEAWAAEQAELASRDQDAADARLDGQAPYGLVVDFAAGDGAYEVDQCARCHARRHRVSPEDKVGRPFLDDFAPALLEVDLYHADGQILEEVYEYGSFVQSRMYHVGVRCSDCHDPHALTLRVPGDAVCVQCHNDLRTDERFPTLRLQRYDATSHHFHDPTSEGARCVSCHMPQRTYMVVDPRRDHGLRIPRPDLAARFGTPDVCTGCHADRTPAWAAETVAGIYPDSERRGPHFAEALSAGRAGRPGAGDRLRELVIDATQPALVRATAVALLADLGGVTASLLTTLGQDEEPLVRAAAASAVQALPPEARTSVALPLLTDPLRSVRSEAAHALLPVPPERLPVPARATWEREHELYLATQRTLLDTPSGCFNLAVVAQAQGRTAEAEAHYARALSLDPGFLPACFNLANLLNGERRNDEAEQVLRAGLVHATRQRAARQRVPQAEESARGELHYSLGLLLAEMGRLDEAEAELGEAGRLIPAAPRVAYNHGLALWQLERLDEAEVALQRAHGLQPREPDALAALLQLALRRGDSADALGWAERLVELGPPPPELEQLVQRLRTELAAGEPPR